MTRRTRPPFLSLKLPFFLGGSLLGIFGILFPMQYIERLAQKAPAKEAEEVQWVFAFGFLEVIFCQHVVTFFYCITLIQFFLCFLQKRSLVKSFSSFFPLRFRLQRGPWTWAQVSTPFAVPDVKETERTFTTASGTALFFLRHKRRLKSMFNKNSQNCCFLYLCCINRERRWKRTTSWLSFDYSVHWIMYQAMVKPRSTDPASKWATNLARAARETEANWVTWKITLWFAVHYPEHSCMDFVNFLPEMDNKTIAPWRWCAVRQAKIKEEAWHACNILHNLFVHVCTKVAMWRSKVLSSWNKLRQICEQAAIELREEVARTAQHCAQRWSFFSTHFGNSKDVVDIGLQFWDLWVLQLTFSSCLRGVWPRSETSGRKSKMTMALRRWRQVLAQACFGLHDTVRGRLLRWMINKEIGQIGMVVAWYS